MKASKSSTPKISIPKTADGCSSTITSSFGAGISVANLLGVNHFPKGGGTLHQKSRMKKILINPDVGGHSRCILSSYYKVSLANFIRKQGAAASAFLIIKKVK